MAFHMHVQLCFIRLSKLVDMCARLMMLVTTCVCVCVWEYRDNPFCKQKKVVLSFCNHDAN